MTHQSKTHSPTPWKIGISMTRQLSDFNLSGESEWPIYDANKERIAVICNSPIKINAAFIVQACNAYDSDQEKIRAYERIIKAIAVFMSPTANFPHASTLMPDSDETFGEAIKAAFRLVKEKS